MNTHFKINNTQNRCFLQAIHDPRKSFYNKAYYTTSEDENALYCHLWSYDTYILTVVISLEKTWYTIDKNCTLSRTTQRHIKEMLKQFLYDTPLFDVLNKTNFSIKSILENSTDKDAA